MHLAQLNVSRMLAPAIDHPIMADFVAQFDTINQLAEGSDGFIWRLKGEGNNATDLRPFDDERIIVNMSVWESPEQLQAFVRGAGAIQESAHSDNERPAEVVREAGRNHRNGGPALPGNDRTVVGSGWARADGGRGPRAARLPQRPRAGANGLSVAGSVAEARSQSGGYSAPILMHSP